MKTGPLIAALSLSASLFTVPAALATEPNPTPADFEPLTAFVDLLNSDTLTRWPACEAGEENPYGDARLKNILLPFHTDGCTKFPNGIPFKNEQAWLHCCVDHDFAYWKGGSAEERAAADEAVGECVTKAGYPLVGWFMSKTVRVTASPALHTSWRWGYGWALDRGVRAHSDEERQQITARTRDLPADKTTLPLHPEDIVPTRATITGDYCVDAGVKFVQETLGRDFTVARKTERARETAGGTVKEISLTVEGCARPFTFEFLLLKRDACLVRAKEAIAATRIRLQNANAPESCAALAR